MVSHPARAHEGRIFRLEDLAGFSGELAEWLNAPVLNTGNRKVRGFESLTLRRAGSDERRYSHSVLEGGPCAFLFMALVDASKQEQ